MKRRKIVKLFYLLLVFLLCGCDAKKNNSITTETIVTENASIETTDELVEVENGTTEIITTEAEELAYIVENAQCGDLNWSLDEEGLLTIWGTGDYDIENVAWYEYREQIKKIKVSASGLTSTRNMFTNLYNVTTIDIKELNTSNVVDMGSMFYGCLILQEIDLSNLDTSNVMDMSSMFGFCESIEYFDLRPLNTSCVLDTSDMFCGCINAKKIDMSNFDMSMVQGADGMFMYCENLEDLGDFDYNYWLLNDTMYSGCNKLDVDTSKLDMTYYIVGPTQTGDLMWSLNSNGHLEVWGEGDYKVSKYSEQWEWYSVPPWCADEYADQIYSAKVSVTGITSTAYMFHDLTNLTSVDLSELDTSSVTNMKDMFDWCTSIEYIDVSGFDTSNVQNMSYMFFQCERLNNLDLSNFDVTNLQRVKSIFVNSYSLNNLIISDEMLHRIISGDPSAFDGSLYSN